MCLCSQSLVLLCCLLNHKNVLSVQNWILRYNTKLEPYNLNYVFYRYPCKIKHFASKSSSHDQKHDQIRSESKGILGPMYKIPSGFFLFRLDSDYSSILILKQIIISCMGIEAYTNQMILV